MDYTTKFPDYEEKGILNLVASLRVAGGDNDCHYKALELDLPKPIQQYDNYLFLILDGMGYNYLQRRGEGTFLLEHLEDRLSTVFPSTTASAITSFLTGMSPSEHCLTGWYTYVKELATATTILTFSPRYSNITFDKMNVDREKVYHFKGVADKMNGNFFLISGNHILNTPFALSHSGNASRIGYDDVLEIPNIVNDILKVKTEKKKFIYLYISTFDKISHQYGIDSDESYVHMKKLDTLVNEISKANDNENSLFIGTADHGFVNVGPEQVLHMDDHPELRECLLMPLMGEPRTPFCYVRPARVGKFLDYIETNLSQYCEVKSSEEVIQEGWFGPDIKNKGLFERVGDYILFMKDNYVFQDNLVVEDRVEFKGYHGGKTAEEMHVPLLVFNK